MSQTLQYTALPTSCRHLIPRRLRRLMIGERCADCGQAVLAHRDGLQAAREAGCQLDQQLRVVCEVCGERGMRAAEMVRSCVLDTGLLEKHFRQD